MRRRPATRNMALRHDMLLWMEFASLALPNCGFRSCLQLLDAGEGAGKR